MLAYRLAGTPLAIAAGLLAGLYPPVLYLSKIAFVQVPYLRGSGQGSGDMIFNY